MELKRLRALQRVLHTIREESLVVPFLKELLMNTANLPSEIDSVSTNGKEITIRFKKEF